MFTSRLQCECITQRGTYFSEASYLYTLGTEDKSGKKYITDGPLTALQNILLGGGGPIERYLLPLV